MEAEKQKVIEECWDAIPSIECQGHCWRSCGEVLSSPAENELVKEWCAKNGVEFHPFETDKPSSAASLINRIDNPRYCPYLKEHRCSIYPVRPAICRMWGNAERLPCFMGCKRHGKRMTDDQSSFVLAVLESL